MSWKEDLELRIKQCEESIQRIQEERNQLFVAYQTQDRKLKEQISSLAVILGDARGRLAVRSHQEKSQRKIPRLF